MKTKLEIIEETVQYYSEDTSRRAVNERGRCSYYDYDTGNMCAVGRCLKNPKGIVGCVSAAVLLNLKDEYKGYKWVFWDDLQQLHDVRGFWDEQGLTEEGSKFVNKLKEMYA